MGSSNTQRALDKADNRTKFIKERQANNTRRLNATARRVDGLAENGSQVVAEMAQLRAEVSKLRIDLHATHNLLNQGLMAACALVFYIGVAQLVGTGWWLCRNFRCKHRNSQETAAAGGVDGEPSVDSVEGKQGKQLKANKAVDSVRTPSSSSRGRPAGLVVNTAAAGSPTVTSAEPSPAPSTDSIFNWPSELGPVPSGRVSPSQYVDMPASSSPQLSETASTADPEAVALVWPQDGSSPLLPPSPAFDEQVMATTVGSDVGAVKTSAAIKTPSKEVKRGKKKR